MGDIALRGQGRALMKKGGRAKDMSEKHEGMESMADEAKETRLEKKGYVETESDKAIAIACLGFFTTGPFFPECNLPALNSLMTLPTFFLSAIIINP